MSQINAVKKSGILLLILPVVLSCASLSKSQLNEVNCFGQLTSNFSACPGTVISTYNSVHEQQELYRANSLDDPETHFRAIVRVNNFKQQADSISPRIDLSLKIIDQYAQALVLLTSGSHARALDTAAKGLGSNLDNLVSVYNKVDAGANLPTGIGSAVAAVITLGGDVYIRKKQADDIREILPLGDKIIDKMTANLLDFLGKPGANGRSLQELIQAERSTIANSYQAFLRNHKIVSVDDDHACLRLLEDLDNAEKLRLQCIEAVTGLRKAHAKLLKDMDQKRTLKQYAEELQSYGDDMKTVYNTINTIKKS